MKDLDKEKEKREMIYQTGYAHIWIFKIGAFF